MPVLVGSRLDEELHLHLLELPHAEHEVARRDLVAERLADLRDPERDLLARGRLDLREVHEHRLGGLGAKEHLVVVVGDRTHVGLEHQVEVAGIGEALAAAVGADAGIRQMVLAEALVAAQALDERIGEHLEVPARLPDLGRHDDGGVEADDVVAPLHHRAPPRLLDVVLELDAQWAVVPRRPQTTVDLGGLEGEAAAFRERDDLIHQVWHLVAPFDAPGRRMRPLAWEPSYLPRGRRIRSATRMR